MYQRFNQRKKEEIKIDLKNKKEGKPELGLNPKGLQIKKSINHN